MSGTEFIESAIQDMHFNRKPKPGKSPKYRCSACGKPLTKKEKEAMEKHIRIMSAGY